MATVKITVHIDDKPVELELKTARKADGIWRAELMGKAVMMEQSPAAMVGFYVFPSCVAAIKSPQWVREISLETFISDVDESDMDTWLEKAYELNPHWKESLRQLATLGEDEEKKTGTPSSGLTQPMETVEVKATSQSLSN